MFVVAEGRAHQAKTLLAAPPELAQWRPDLVAAGLAGSLACGDARMDPDVALLTEDLASPPDHAGVRLRFVGRVPGQEPVPVELQEAHEDRH